MPWPIPAPGDVANRAAAVFETDLPRIWRLKNPSAPPATVDARSNVSQLAVYSRTVDLAASDLWFFLDRNSQELMADTAVDWLPRHAAIWGVPQIQAIAATGNVVFTERPATAIPSGLALSAAGLTYRTAGSGATTGGGTVSIPVVADVAGSAGSQPPGTVLTLVNPQAGFTIQSAIVDSGGLTGEDAETTDQWRARILARIRNRGAGGSGADFQRWAAEALPGLLVRAVSPGTGFINVAFAMPSGQTWRAPTSPEIAVLSAYLNDAYNRKPLGAPFINVVAATLQTVNFSLHLNPDTAANRTAATNALTLQLLADATIGATLFMSRMDAAVENASGEFSHERATPSADVTAAATTVSIIGTVSFI